ncbi:MAG: UbiA family prenyltransferase, partial [Nitriliruptoraceae bacterium]
TDQNIVIGGVAGAAPPMIGWAAVTGSVSWPAIAMFMVVVMWTPIHFWSLAIGTGSDYADAGIPMLSAVRGNRAAARHGAVYAIATALCTIAVPLAGVGGTGLMVILVALGVWFVARSLALVADPTPARAWRTFHLSNAYLACVFVAIGVAGVLE